jgi:hypothetical protein
VRHGIDGHSRIVVHGTLVYITLLTQIANKVKKTYYKQYDTECWSCVVRHVLLGG